MTPTLWMLPSRRVVLGWCPSIDVCLGTATNHAYLAWATMMPEGRYRRSEWTKGVARS